MSKFVKIAKFVSLSGAASLGAVYGTPFVFNAVIGLTNSESNSMASKVTYGACAAVTGVVTAAATAAITEAVVQGCEWVSDRFSKTEPDNTAPKSNSDQSGTTAQAAPKKEQAAPKENVSPSPKTETQPEPQQPVKAAAEQAASPKEPHVTVRESDVVIVMGNNQAKEETKENPEKQDIPEMNVKATSPLGNLSEALAKSAQKGSQKDPSKAEPTDIYKAVTELAGAVANAAGKDKKTVESDLQEAVEKLANKFSGGDAAATV